MVSMAWETERTALELATVRAGVANAMNRPEYGFYVVAEIGDMVVGCMMITYEWSDWRNACQWWIQSVYVAPTHRRQGVFKRLYAFVEESAMEQRGVCGLRLYVEKDNMKAMKTYRSLGMEPTDYLVYEAPLEHRAKIENSPNQGDLI